MTLLVSACAFGAFILLVLPAGVTAINDDFGYLRSVVETLQRDRLWTDDWLEPWAGGISGISALIFKLTGSFYLATNGLLAAAAALAFWASARLLENRGLPLRRAMATAALLLTFPTFLWKSLEFTGVALYQAALLCALLAAERRRWGWFGLVWLLALATRQSALTWIVLPAGSVVGPWRDRSESRSTAIWLMPVAVAAAGAAAFLVLGRFMNQTHAQAMADSVFDHFVVHVREHVGVGRIAEISAVGMSVFLIAAGLGGWALQPWPWARFRPAWGRGLIGLGAAALVVRFGGLIAVEHDSFQGYLGMFYLGVLVLTGVVGWAGATARAVSWPMAGCALASLAALCLRGAVWDYYLLDIALFGFFGIVSAKPAPVAAPGAAKGLAGWIAWTAVAALVTCHTIFILSFKVRFDRAHALIHLAEEGLRAGKLAPSELAFAPFGFQGWHLYPYYIAHEGQTSINIAGFGGYIGTGVVAVGQGYSRALHVFPPFRHEPPADRSTLIGQVAFRCGWLFRGEFFLMRIPVEKLAPPVWKLDPHDYHPQLFPLNDSEWRALIGRKPG